MQIIEKCKCGGLTTYNHDPSSGKVDHACVDCNKVFETISADEHHLEQWRKYWRSLKDENSGKYIRPYPTGRSSYN